jgi:hypothetical protein
VKAYILTEDDFERLRLRLEKDPNRGLVRIDGAHRVAHNEALRKMTFEVESWIAEVKRDA